MVNKTTHKIMLLIGLAVLLATSATLIFIGSFMINVSGSLKDLYNSTQVLIPTITILTIGVFIAILGIVGFIGCIMEKKTFLLIFFFMMCILFIAEIIALILGFVLKDQIDGKVHMVLLKSMSFYYKDLSLRKEIDYIQSSFKCCGVKDYDDWYNLDLFMPKSCCESGACIRSNLIPSLTNFVVPDLTTPYKQGCAVKVDAFLKDKFVYLMVVLGIVIVIQMISLVAACGIICKARRANYRQFSNGLRV